MKKKLRIYIPTSKLDKRLAGLLLLWFISFLIYSTEPQFLSQDLLGLVVIIATLYSLYFVISNFFIYESTDGEYNGYLIIENDKITCNMDVHTFDEIERISILSDYYRGKFNGKTSPWKRKRSNGVKNYIEIHKKDGVQKKYFFLQDKTENIKMFSDELRTYYRFGKLGEQNYKNIVN